MILLYFLIITSIFYSFHIDLSVLPAQVHICMHVLQSWGPENTAILVCSFLLKHSWKWYTVYHRFIIKPIMNGDRYLAQRQTLCLQVTHTENNNFCVSSAVKCTVSSARSPDWHMPKSVGGCLAHICVIALECFLQFLSKAPFCFLPNLSRGAQCRK